MSDRTCRRAILSLSVSSVALLIAAPGVAAAQTASQQPAQQRCTDPATVRPDGSCPREDQATPPSDSPNAPRSMAEIPSSGGTVDGNDVVVTGSRLATRANATNGPVQVLGSADIEARGFNTLGDALNQLPAFGVPDSSPVGLQSSFGPAQSFVNFFGLGSQRTLTLVNSHRFVGSNTSAIFGPTGSGGDQVDLNVIPTKLIDRTEIVAVGGAPIYGSDAISGTINVILKKDYQGIDLDAQSGVTDYGDAPAYRVRALAGYNFGGGRGNITFAGEYNQQTGLLYTDRDLSAAGYYYDTPTTAGYPFTRQRYINRLLPGISENGIPLVGRIGADFLGLNSLLPPNYQLQYGKYLAPYLGVTATNAFNIGVRNGTTTSDLRFDPTGNLIPVDFGQPTSVTNSSGGNGYSLTALSNLLTNTKRYSGVVTGKYDITSNITFSMEGWYTHSEGTNLRDQPEYNSGLFDVPGAPSGGIILSTNNPFLSPAARTTILREIANNPLSDQNLGYTGNQNYFYLDRANTDLVTGQVRGTVDIVRFVGSLDGDFHVGSHDWKWEVSGNYGRSVTRSSIPTINFQNFQNAAGAVTDANPNGIPCLAGLPNSSGPTITTSCAPLNLFGNGVASQAARDYVTMIATPRSLNTQQDYIASLTGGLFRLPGGDVAFAAGYEHRAEHEDFNPSPAYRGAPDTNPLVDSNGDGDPTNDYTSYGQTVPIAPINAGYHTDEVFGELELPLVGRDQNIPLIRSLTFKGAGRYVKNSVNGGAFTWTAGASYEPISSLTLRGNYTRAIRSPSITESQNPSQQYFDFADDPCDPANIGNGPNAAQRAKNCQTAFNALGVSLANYSALSNQRSFLQAVRGDATLRNETANSWTVGGVFQPTFLRGLTVSADYVSIDVNGVITSLTADDVLSNCYDSASFPNNAFCSRVLRDNTGQLSYIVTGYANADQLRYRGILAQGQYKVATPFLGSKSAIGLGASYQHYLELSETAAGVKTRTDGDVGYSRDKGVFTFTYDNGGFNYYAQVQYIGPASLDVNVAPNYYPQNHVNAIAFTNMAVSYELNNRFQLRFNVDNVFATKPPYPTAGTSTVYFQGLEGRYYRVGVSVHF